MTSVEISPRIFATWTFFSKADEMRSNVLHAITFAALTALVLAFFPGCEPDESDDASAASGDSDEENTNTDTNTMAACTGACRFMEECLDPFSENNDPTADPACITACVNGAYGANFADCANSVSDCQGLQLCLQEIDGDVPDPGDGDIDKSDMELPENCEGACGETVTAFCIDSDLCVCTDGSWNPIYCMSLCIEGGQRFLRCAYNKQTGYDQCICVPELCEGSCLEESSGFCSDDLNFCLCLRGSWRTLDCDVFCREEEGLSGGHCNEGIDNDGCVCNDTR